MHIEAQVWIEESAHKVRSALDRIDVLEIGALDVNGGLRHLYRNARWLGVDFMPGPGVDVVADAGEWRPTGEQMPVGGFDLVICAEVLEHCPRWYRLIDTARAVVHPTGAFICTAATEPRAQHGAYDPDGTYGVLPGEFYGNVDVSDLVVLLRTAGFTWIDLRVDARRGDVYVCARP